MRVKITYTPTGSSEQHEDIQRWPDVATLEEVTPHAITYLDRQYGQGNYTLTGIEEA